ncbi:MAG: hypothetical protein HY903_14165 [Deltaproteobacteria bacterium]|nr:hypothetical protein [Deltaproteobacteria bacterium]
MRLSIVLALLAFSGCKCMGEKLLETATGGQVKLDGTSLTIKNDKGETVTFAGEGKDGKGTLVVTNDKGETATFQGDDKGVKIESKDGIAEFGTGKIPEGFPLPVIEGATVASGTHNKTPKGDGYTLMLSVAKDPVAVADFYEKALKGKGLKVERVQNPMMAGMVVLNGKKDKLSASCTAMREAPDKPTSVIIGWQPE